jgi:oxygen-dependent protoporphyrinogen oxidase
LSWPGKLRLAGELLVPRRADTSDESLANFVRRRFGAEALDRLVQPLVGGIYTSDPETLSLKATLPRFIEQERNYGSLIRAAWAAKSQAGDEDRTSGGARYGLFAGLRGGMRELIDALAQRVSDGCQIHLSSRVVRIQDAAPESKQNSPRFSLHFESGAAQEFDAVILTPPAYQAAEMLSSLDAGLGERLRRMEYASSVVVVTGHRLADIEHPLHSFGLVIPHKEGRRILAVSFSSRKFPNRAPEGRVLLRTFVGGALQPELFNLDDPALLSLVKDELQATLGVRGEPDFALVVRYPRAMPQYHVGHLDLVAEIERKANEHPGLVLAGNAYHGVGVPDAIASGERAAEQICGHREPAASNPTAE